VNTQSLVGDREKARYLLGGIYNTALGYTLFALLYTGLHRRVHYLAILVIAQSVSVANNYMVYRWFVFRVRGHALADGARFSTVYLVTFLANLAALPFLIDVAGLPALVAQAVVIVGVMVTSYLAHKRFSFRRPPN
jgi:putative flippase GtrA